MSYLISSNRNNVSPFAGFREIEDRLNRVFGGAPTAACPTVDRWSPSVDLHESDEAYTIEADLPGLKKEDISLTVEEELVTIKGTRNQSTEHKEEGYRRIERSYGTFQRAFRIPGGVDNSKVEANYEHGVLKVTLPKPEQTKPKQIDVKVN